ARSCATSSHQSSHSAVAYSGCEPTSRYRRAALRRNTFELRPIATTGRNSSRAAASGSSARDPSARTHTSPYSVSRPPTRRFIGSLPALLHEGAHESLGVRLEHRVDLVEQVVGRLGGGEGLPAGDGLGARLVVGTGAGGVQGLLGHGVLLVSVVWSAGAAGSVERLEDGLGVVGGVDAVLRAPVRGAQARVGQA